MPNRTIIAVEVWHNLRACRSGCGESAGNADCGGLSTGEAWTEHVNSTLQNGNMSENRTDPPMVKNEGATRSRRTGQVSRFC